MKLWDSHAHLDRLQPDERAAGLRALGDDYAALVPGIEPRDTERALRDGLVAELEPARIHLGAALHPWYLERSPTTDPRWLAVRTLAADPRISAVGETGLDHLRHATASERELALEWFDAHLRLAGEVEKPVVVHCVRAHADCADAIRRSPPARGGVVHAFAGSAEEAAAYERLGFLVGIGPAVTRERSARVRAAAAAVPDHQLLVETDAPFMAPDGRGRDAGTLADIRRVVEVVAELRGVAPEAVAELTWRNAERLFAA